MAQSVVARSCPGPLISSVFSQRTYRMPKEIRVEPQKFAAELIHRLEAIQRTREAEEKLEERLKRVRMVSGPMSGWPLVVWPRPD